MSGYLVSFVVGTRRPHCMSCQTPSRYGVVGMLAAGADADLVYVGIRVVGCMGERLLGCGTWVFVCGLGLVCVSSVAFVGIGFYSLCVGVRGHHACGYKVRLCAFHQNGCITCTCFCLGIRG